MKTKEEKVVLVYVSNAEDGSIGTHILQPDGSLQTGAAVEVAKSVGPLAVDRARRLLVVAARAKPFTAYAYSIDPRSGSLAPLGSAPLAESLPYITFDRSGRFLLGASYGGDLVCVNPVAADGRLGGPQQVIPTARNAHAIIVDRTNRFAFVPHLGTDQVFQFLFDGKSGRLSPNSMPIAQLKAGSGPRHLVASADNRFIYVLGELDATITTLALDGGTGSLVQRNVASFLPAGSTLRPGAPRPAPGRTVDNDIWASDLHLTPDGRFLYAAERTRSTISTMAVDAVTGALSFRGSVQTEKQPRGFRIDPSGRFMVVSGEKSDTISSYAIDGSTGALRLIGRYPTGKGSNWVEIVSFD
jgi:6-phosphogluconolactonase